MTFDGVLCILLQLNLENCVPSLTFQGKTSIMIAGGPIWST